VERDVALLALAVGRGTSCNRCGRCGHGCVGSSDSGDARHEIVRDVLQVRLDARGMEGLVVSQESQIARVVFEVGLSTYVTGEHDVKSRLLARQDAP
jgi:hypothetical protein